MRGVMLPSERLGSSVEIPPEGEKFKGPALPTVWEASFSAAAWSLRREASAWMSFVSREVLHGMKAAVGSKGGPRSFEGQDAREGVPESFDLLCRRCCLSRIQEQTALGPRPSQGRI